VAEPLTPEDRRTKERLPLIQSSLVRLRTRRAPTLPHEGPVEEGPGSLGAKSGAFRAAVFGVNDGLLSNLSLIMGVNGAGVSNQTIILAGIAGLLAGAFSMGAGEFVSMRAQREVFERLIHLEAHEIGSEPEEEREELAALYERRGISSDLAQRLAHELMQDPDVALNTHAREELGLDPASLGSPWAAAFSSFSMFVLGAILPLIPFWITSGSAATITAVIVAAAALIAIGSAMSILTGRSAVWSGLRMLLIGAIAASVTFGVGKVLHSTAGL
jgi:VIT1/CCC1 family predicted Fe2+/Mn2+ transporter